MPNLDGPVLAATHDDRLSGMKARKRDIGGMSFEGLYTSLGLIIPDFDEFVVSRGDEIWFIACVIVVDVVDAFVVRVESVVCGGGGEVPDLDRAVKTRGGKCVGVFGVDGKGHNVMGMTLEHSKTLPVLIPVP